MSFHVGQKVICVNGRARTELGRNGSMATAPLREPYTQSPPSLLIMAKNALLFLNILALGEVRSVVLLYGASVLYNPHRFLKS